MCLTSPHHGARCRAPRRCCFIISASGSFSTRFYESAIDNQIFDAPVSGDSDTPSYRQARASAQWPQWEQSCKDEISSLKMNGTSDEDQSVLEDTLFLGLGDS